jgi:hypothetical protein
MSEEYTLLCDVPECEAAVAMVSEVARSEHGWGRVSLYTDATDTQDYDLCPQHLKAMRSVLTNRII